MADPDGGFYLASSTTLQRTMRASMVVTPVYKTYSKIR